MELERALKLISDNKDVDPELFNTAVHAALHDTVSIIRNRLERTNLYSTENGGKWIQLGDVYSSQMEKTRDNSTFQWKSAFTAGNHCEIVIMVTVLNFGTYSHEPSITVKLEDADKSIRYMKDVWFKDNGCSLIYELALDALNSLPQPEPLKVDDVCKADEPTRTEWFYMTFWPYSTSLRDIVRSTDYDEIVTKWKRDSNKKLCTPIMNGLCPTIDIEQKSLDELSKKVNKDNDFITLAADFGNWAESVKIGNQEWTKVNLRLDDGGEGIYHNDYNGETYYTWEAARRVAGKIPGWHLPTREEWQELVDFCGGDEKAGNALKASTGWYADANGSDEFGFSAVPGGNWNYNFRYVSLRAYFWTATEYGCNGAYGKYFDSCSTVYEYRNNRYRGHSIRLVKDSDKKDAPA